MKKWLFAVLLGSALVLGACGGDNDDNNNNNNNGNNNNQTEENGNNVQDTAAAEDLYKNNCATCHGDDLKGVSGPDLTDAGANHDADEIQDIIQNGQGGMPAQNLDDDDSAELAEWLASKK